MSIMSIAEEIIMYVPGQNGIFNISNFDNLTGWMLEMCTHISGIEISSIPVPCHP